MDQITFTIEIDDDGFIWRQCPDCRQKFKWHHGPLEGAELEDEPQGGYFCPYCASHHEVPSWNTDEQNQTALQVFLPAASNYMRETIGELGCSTRGSLVNIEFEYSEPEVPLTAVELDDDDLELIMSPCHPSEPLKVYLAEDHTISCLVCGESFSV